MRRIHYIGFVCLAVLGLSQSLLACVVDPDNGGSSGVPGSRCAPPIDGNAAAAGVCGPVCDRDGLSFGGSWTNDATNPEVAACTASGGGSAVCGCAARP